MRVVIGLGWSSRLSMPLDSRHVKAKGKCRKLLEVWQSGGSARTRAVWPSFAEEREIFYFLYTARTVSNVRFRSSKSIRHSFLPFLEYVIHLSSYSVEGESNKACTWCRSRTGDSTRTTFPADKGPARRDVWFVIIFLAWRTYTLQHPIGDPGKWRRMLCRVTRHRLISHVEIWPIAVIGLVLYLRMQVSSSIEIPATAAR